MRRGSGDDPARARLLAGPTWSRCEGLITAFELAWRRGETPSLRDYLRADGEAGHALLVELAHVDLEFRLKAGEAARVEAYLADFPALAADAGAVVGLLEAECDLRRRRGEAVGRGEYGSRFPALPGAPLRRRGENPLPAPDLRPPGPARA